MLHVSFFVEMLRSQPRLMFWFAALAQAALWWLVPSIFYSSPPGGLPEVLAVGAEFQLGSFWGPPLAFWLAEIAYVIAGITGVYLLSQVCIVAAYWIIFKLGQAIVGIHHAAMAVLLMVGIAAFTVPTPDFGPAVAAMPLAAVCLLHFWYAIGEGRRGYWFILALDLGVLLLTSYAGIVLLGLVALFTVTSKRGRRMLASVEPWIAAVIIVVVLFPHLIWLDAVGGGFAAILDRIASDAAETNPVFNWGRQTLTIALAHAGAAVLAALAIGWRLRRSGAAPAFQRGSLTNFERRFVLFFAFGSPLGATLLAALFGLRGPIGGLAPHLVLSGLAIVVLAGNSISLYRQRITALAWTLLLVAPPAFAAGAIFVLPWTAGIEVPVGQPAQDMGRFFGESFERSTGKPLAVVAGDPRLASLIALAAPSRPSLYLDASPERTPWVGGDEIRRKGAIVVWPASDTSGQPPPEIKARFPGLVPSLPRAFAREVQGRLPLLRVGWGMLRPQ